MVLDRPAARGYTTFHYERAVAVLRSLLLRL